MLTGLAWLALEIESLEPALAFYGDALGMERRNRRTNAGDATDANDGAETPATREVAFAAGETDLLLRRPTAVPRGGLHTHFAFSIPAAEYDDWWARLESELEGDLEEVSFGGAKSLYCFDPDGNCVELGQRDVDGPGIEGVFEVVLEVADLEAAESFYAALGFETVDCGDDRRRIRMDGPMALELWEPQLGLADARGGVHVDLGFETADPDGVVDAVADRACSLERENDGGGIVVRDPDGHHLAFFEGDGE